MELYHYGIKGQKRGVRRYQYEDGSLTTEGRVHYNVGPPRNSYTLKKGTMFYRTSSVEEKDVRKGTYVTSDPITAVHYQNDGIEGGLDFDTKILDKSIYAVKIEALDKVKVLKGQKIIDDILADAPNANVEDIHKKIKESGMYDAKSFIEKSDIQDELNESKTVPIKNQIKAANYLDDYLKDNRDILYKKYSDLGYDAIEDPMDSMYSYYKPMILLNNDKFKVTSATKKTSKEVRDDKKALEKKIDEEYDKLYKAKQKGQ